MKLEQVSKAYGGKSVLEEITLEIPKQQLTAFIGANGAGKSTLLALMSRLLTKDAGSLIFKEKAIEAWSTRDLAQALSMLKQQQHYQAKLTVEELVSFGRFPYSQGRLTSQDHEKIEQALLYLDLQALRTRFINTLSGGQLQRVYIAMVLAQDTDLILLDEPLNNLDIKQSVMMMKILRQLVDELGKTVVMVVHDINMASQYADYIVAFKQGRLFQQGPTAQVMTKEILDELYEMDLTLTQVAGKTVCLYL